ncbi:hypothetical protein ACFLUL_01985 [Chloroflexota bacterium]
MKRLQAKPLFRTIFAVSLILSLLTVSTSCQVTSDEERLIEGILENLDMVNGEMTIVTEDGETITIKITTSNSEEGENLEYDELEAGTPVKVTVEDGSHADMEDVEVQHKDGENGDNYEAEDTYDDDDSGNKPSVAVADLSSILPSMASIEDVFRVLGVWEDAEEFREMGLAWSHIAEELDYNQERMRSRLQDMAEELLKAARDAGLITQEQLEAKFRYFDEMAAKWIGKIFADTEVEAVSDVDLESILPSLESIEDVFRVLGVWEDAVAWHEEGLTWAHIADELGYTMEKMYAELMEIAEEYLWAAKEAGLINHEQFEEMFTRFDELAEGWIHEIY